MLQLFLLKPANHRRSRRTF